MSGEAPDPREAECPSHEACGGWCDLHQVITEKDAAYLRHLLVNFRQSPHMFEVHDDSDVTATDVMDAIQSIIRERIYCAWDDGFMAGADAESDFGESRPPYINPYGWTGHTV